MNKTTHKTQIILLDDNLDYGNAIVEFLSLKGFEVRAVTSVEAFEAHLQDAIPNLILLDNELGGRRQGVDLIVPLRKDARTRNVPVLMLTGSVVQEERLQALRLGADDYIVKSTSVDELYLRIVAALRRATVFRDGDDRIALGNVELNLSSGRAFVENQEMVLTKIEFNLLHEMVSHSNQILYRDSLAKKHLTVRNQNVRTLDVHINSLRKKLGPTAKNLRTVRGRGYVFESSTS